MQQKQEKGGREGGREGEKKGRTCAVAMLLFKRDKLAVKVRDLLSWQVV